MFTPEMLASVKKVEATRQERLGMEPRRMTAEEKDALLKAYHPDYREDGFDTIKIGPNKGEKVPKELGHLLHSNSRLLHHPIDLTKIDYDTDVLIIGGGGAGASAAIEADNAGAKVMIVTKLRIGDANTMMAEGGIQAADKENDSPVQHYLDAFGGGHFAARPELLRRLVMEAPDAIKWLNELGVMFDKTEDGTMVTGWLDLEDGKYYYDLEGLKCVGWQEIEGKYYFFDEDGLMQTGWHEEGEYSYYLQEDGSAATGRQELEGQVYYFTPKGIMVVLVNKDNPIPSYYKTDVVVAEDYHLIQRVAQEPLQKMLADCRAAVGSCGFNSSYRTQKEQTEILETRTQEYMDTGMTYQEAYEETLKTVALPGTSEHQLGLSADLTGKEANEWLAEHCWEYGFILRYPEGKKDITGIINEPWHFRYVGTRVSLDMKDTGLCLEEYLGAV